MKIHSTPRWSALAVLLILLLFVIPASAAGTWVTENASSSNPEPIAADISGSHVVYSVAYGEAINHSTPRGLLLYDADTATTTSLAYASGKMTLTGGQTAGDAVVWFEEASALISDPSEPVINNSVYLFSISTGTNTSIRSSPSAEWPKTDGIRVIWSETSEQTYLSTLSIYDIAAQTTETLPVHPQDGASVMLDGDTIAFCDANTSALTLYDIPSQKKTVIYVPVHSNTTYTNVFDYVMAGDELLYKIRIVETSPKRAFTNALTWYSITEGTEVTLSPITGQPVETLTEDEQTATFDSLFTDGNTIGWVLEPGISKSALITVNTETMNVSHLKIDGDVAFPSIDGRRATWVQSKMMADSHLVLATWHDPADDETPTTTAPETTSAPGFGVLCAAGALAVLSLGRKK